MSDQELYKMPKEVETAFNAIRQAVVQLFAMWQVYTSFQKPQHQAIMRETTPDVFGLIMMALHNAITMAHGRLLDPAESKVRGVLLPNLSLARLLKTVKQHCPAQVFDGFQKKFNEAEKHCKPILVWRDKQTAHSDWKTAFDSANHPLPKIDQEEITQGLKILAEVLDDIDMFYNDRTTAFAYPIMYGTADDLIRILGEYLVLKDQDFKRQFGFNLRPPQKE